MSRNSANTLDELDKEYKLDIKPVIKKRKSNEKDFKTMSLIKLEIMECPICKETNPTRFVMVCNQCGIMLCKKCADDILDKVKCPVCCCSQIRPLGFYEKILVQQSKTECSRCKCVFTIENELTLLTHELQCILGQTYVVKAKGDVDQLINDLTLKRNCCLKWYPTNELEIALKKTSELVANGIA